MLLTPYCVQQEIKQHTGDPLLKGIVDIRVDSEYIRIDYTEPGGEQLDAVRYFFSLVFPRNYYPLTERIELDNLDGDSLYLVWNLVNGEDK